MVGALQYYRVAGGSGGSGGGGGGPLSTVRPVSALALRKSFGVNAQPSRSDFNYSGNPSGTYNAANVDAWCKLLVDAGVYYFRGLYTPGNAGTRNAVASCRKYGLKWLMLTCPEGNAATTQTDAGLTTCINDISANAWDICYGIEGVNEPNQNRGTGVPPPPGDWAAITAARQQVISDGIAAHTNLSGVIKMGPSLHDVNADKSYTAANTCKTNAGVASVQWKPAVGSVGALPTTGNIAGDTRLIDGTTNNYTWTGSTWSGPVAVEGGIMHWHQLQIAGLATTCDYFGLHTYASNGGVPTTKLDARVSYIDQAFGAGAQVWATEWGYTTVDNLASGHAVATPEAAGTYTTRGILEFFGGYGQGVNRRAIPISYYETLDDYEPLTNNSTVEAHFGLLYVGQSSDLASRQPAEWTPKPAVPRLTSFLTLLAEPGVTAAYQPAAVGLAIDVGTAADVRYLAVGKADGTVRLFLWRSASVMDTKTKAAISVAPMPVKVSDALGTTTISVGPEVTSVTVNR